MTADVEAGPVDDLADLDPNDCSTCVAAGDLCPFHVGFAEGWDACAVLVARLVTGDD